jgi:asparagine synthase (glutamine-hydrolysing)
MANLIGIIGDVKESRDKYLSSIKSRLLTFDWLKYDDKELHDGAIAWAAIPSAPICISEQADNGVSFIMGNIYRENASRVSDAEYLQQQIKIKGCLSISGQNGYYLAFTVDSSGMISLGTDILGLFPIYYYSTNDFLLFSTTPSLFRHYPEFTPELSMHGLVGILLTMHITGGQTIWKGVRRLTPGHILQWSKGKAAYELKSDAIQPSFDHVGGSIQDHVEIFDYLLKKIIARETDNRETSIMLSGGLDSRIIAGYLGKARGSDLPACTFGESNDNEMKCAAKVARTLNWSHRRVPVDFSKFREFAWKQLELEQLSNGFTDLAFFQGVETLHGVKPFIFTGLWGDAVMGGSRLRCGYDKSKKGYTFDELFRNNNRYGLTPGLVKKLIPPELLGNSLEEVMEDLKNAFCCPDGLPYQRSLMFDLAHRLRCYVGSYAWRISFGAWPVLPYVDKEILFAAVGMPVSSLLERRVQVELLCQYFPELAVLPLDRNTPDTSPLIQTFAIRVSYRLLIPVFKRLFVKHDAERRYYYRVLDINNPGWSAVRREAEIYRSRAETIFDPVVLRELLPPPDVRLHFNDPMVDSNANKTLLGFFLWAGRNL